MSQSHQIHNCECGHDPMSHPCVDGVVVCKVCHAESRPKMRLLAENVGVYWVEDGVVELRIFHDEAHRVLTSITIGPDKVEGYTFDRDTSEMTDEWEKVKPT